MKKTKKHITLAIIAIMIAALAFGYAYLTTTLSINGTTDIDANNWDVYFDNVVVTPGSVSGTQEIEPPTITSDTEVEFHVNLKKPGDFYEFTIEARNDGTIDAMINSVSKKLNNAEVTTLPSYLNYTVTYEDDIEIEDNHLLAAESLETYKIRVEFKKNISASDLPSSAQSLTLSFGVEYVQADENVQQVRKIIYSGSSIEATTGSPLPNGINPYNNPEDAMAEFGYPMFLRYTIINNVVAKTEIGVKYNDNIFYLVGGGATYNSSTESYNYDSIYYADNIASITNGYGVGCVNHGNIQPMYSCGDSGHYYQIGGNGRISTAITSEHKHCYYNLNGKSACSAYVPG